MREGNAAESTLSAAQKPGPAPRVRAERGGLRTLFCPLLRTEWLWPRSLQLGLSKAGTIPPLPEAGKSSPWTLVSKLLAVHTVFLRGETKATETEVASRSPRREDKCSRVFVNTLCETDRLINDAMEKAAVSAQPTGGGIGPGAENWRRPGNETSASI